MHLSFPPLAYTRITECNSLPYLPGYAWPPVLCFFFDKEVSQQSCSERRQTSHNSAMILIFHLVHRTGSCMTSSSKALIDVLDLQLILASPRGRAWNQYSPSLGSTMNVAFLAQVYSEYIKPGGGNAERRAKRYSCWAQTQVGRPTLAPFAACPSYFDACTMRNLPCFC